MLRGFGCECGDNIIGHNHSFGDMVAYMVRAYHAVYACMFERLAHVGLDSRKHNVDAFFLRRADEYLEVVKTRSVDKRYFTHADYAHKRF